MSYTTGTFTTDEVANYKKAKLNRELQVFKTNVFHIIFIILIHDILLFLRVEFIKQSCTKAKHPEESITYKTRNSSFEGLYVYMFVTAVKVGVIMVLLMVYLIRNKTIFVNSTSL